MSGDEIRDLLHYEPETGKFRFRVDHGQRKAGQELKPHMEGGYARLYVGGKLIRAHRLAWLCFHGEWPKGMLDHINRDKADNRISNLRIVNQSLNQQNVVSARRNNKLGVLGVTKSRCGTYVATIWLDGKSQYIGSYKSIDLASDAYMRAKVQHHEGYAA